MFLAPQKSYKRKQEIIKSFCKVLFGNLIISKDKGLEKTHVGKTLRSVLVVWGDLRALYVEGSWSFGPAAIYAEL